MNTRLASAAARSSLDTHEFDDILFIRCIVIRVYLKPHMIKCRLKAAAADMAHMSSIIVFIAMDSPRLGAQLSHAGRLQGHDSILVWLQSANFNADIGAWDTSKSPPRLTCSIRRRASTPITVPGTHQKSRRLRVASLPSLSCHRLLCCEFGAARLSRCMGPDGSIAQICNGHCLINRKHQCNELETHS